MDNYSTNNPPAMKIDAATGPSASNSMASEPLPAIAHILDLLAKAHAGDKEAMAACVSCLHVASHAWSAQNHRVQTLETQVEMLRGTVQELLDQIANMSKDFKSQGPSGRDGLPPRDPHVSVVPFSAHEGRRNKGLFARLAAGFGF